MNVNYRWLARSLAVLSLSFMLSGCFSIMLMMKSQPHTTKENWKSDTITGLSLAQDSDGKKGYVFVGETFDYLLTQGADGVVRLLKDPGIDRNKLKVVDKAEFIISDNKKEFQGAITLKYDGKREEVAEYGFSCSEPTSCTLKVSNLKGTIHKKNKKQDYSQVLAFYHPFKVEFYQYETSGLSSGVAKVLLPVTITLDIVTSPLQLLTLGIITSGK